MSREERVTAWLRECFRRRVVLEALKVSLVVGTVLNLINHFGLLSGHGLTMKGLGEVLLNYAVPFAVSSHGQAAASVREGTPVEDVRAG